MIMSYIRPEENFEPTQQTKGKWRFTRKAPATFAGIKLIGLFQTSNYPMDVALFFVVVGLEIWGLVSLVSVGEASLVFVPFLFLLDVVLAVFRHIPEGNINECENKLIVAGNNEDEARLDQSIRKSKAITIVFTLLIAVMAIFKIISFFLLYNKIDGLTIGITVAYMLAAFLHCSTTGYFLSGLLFAMMMNKDRKEYLQSGAKSTDNSKKHSMRINQHREFVLPEYKGLETYQVGKHEIAYDEKRKQYVLRTWGVLEDRDLHALIGHQRVDEAKRIVAVEGIKAQLAIMQSDPATTSRSLGQNYGDRDAS
jgi:hypothetical protein